LDEAIRQQIDKSQLLNTQVEADAQRTVANIGK